MPIELVQEHWLHVHQPTTPQQGEAFMWLAGPQQPSPFWQNVGHIPWPAWLPRQLYITRARAGRQGFATPYGQYAVVVDRGGKAFKTSSPPSYQLKPDGVTFCDWSNNGGLVSVWPVPAMPEPHEVANLWTPPVFFDADAGDLLWVQQDRGHDQWFFQLSFLQLAPGVPYVAGPGVPPPINFAAIPLGWEISAGAMALPVKTGASAYNNHTISVTIEPSAVHQYATHGTQTRVAFRSARDLSTAAPQDPPLVITSAYIGPRTGDHTASSMVPLLFNGSSPGVTIPAYDQRDPFGVPGIGLGVAAGSIDGSNGYVIKAHIASGPMMVNANSLPGWKAAWAGGANLSASPSAAGLTPANGSSLAVVAVEKLL